MVYLPMSWLYSARATGPLTPVVQALRGEIFPVPHDDMDWRKVRDQCSLLDLYQPQARLMRFAHRLLHLYEATMGGKEGVFRKPGLDFAMEYMHAEAPPQRPSPPALNPHPNPP